MKNYYMIMPARPAKWNMFGPFSASNATAAKRRLVTRILFETGTSKEPMLCGQPIGTSSTVADIERIVTYDAHVVPINYTPSVVLRLPSHSSDHAPVDWDISLFDENHKERNIVALDTGHGDIMLAVCAIMDGTDDDWVPLKTRRRRVIADSHIMSSIYDVTFRGYTIATDIEAMSKADAIRKLDMKVNVISPSPWSLGNPRLLT